MSLYYFTPLPYPQNFQPSMIARFRVCSKPGIARRTKPS